MDSNKDLLELLKEQQRILENSIKELFDKSIEGLDKTLKEVVNLKKTHAWYHSNVYQITQLKSKITDIQNEYDENIKSILSQIESQKKHAKEILFTALNQLKSTINTTQVSADISQLLSRIDKLIDDVAPQLLLAQIFATVGLFGIIAAIIGILLGGSVFGFATLGIGVIIGGTASEIMFRDKLNELIKLLKDNIQIVQNKKTEQIKIFKHYFESLQNNFINGQTSIINIVWYDKQIKEISNQFCFEELKEEFSDDNCHIIEMHEKNQLIKFILSNTLNKIILITSGSSGEDIISQIGYYFHITGIIIYCSAVEYHQTWADQYKKVLCVTNSFCDVIQQIKDIQNGNIYFLNFGFSYEDINLKLNNPNYYLSTKQNDFIIKNFKDINLNINHQNRLMTQLYNSLKQKNIFHNDIPTYFHIENLLLCAQKFVDALEKPQPENNLLRLYTSGRPYYYRIINHILNLLDEELISLIQDYIKALRYSLIIYSDPSNKIPNTKNVKLYRGLNLDNTNLENFLKKFKINDTIVFPGFTSTSLNETPAKSFAGKKGVLLEISADCTQSNKPKSVSLLSHFQHEDEVLLNCFSLLTVKNITKTNDDLIWYQCKLKPYEL